MTLSFLTESKASHVGITSMRRVVITLLVMLLASVSALAQNYWLTLDPNYEGAMGNRIPVSSFKPTYTLTSNVEPTREGHTFYGWSTTPTGIIEYITDETVTLTGDLTLYAVWDYPYVVGDVKTIGSLKYKITNANPKQVELYGYEGEISTGTLNIPATVTIDGIEFSVTSIGDGAFGYCTNLESVTIPNSVTSIGERAFMDCVYLTDVTIPNSVTSIGSWAFSFCRSLEHVEIPDGVTSIENNTFNGCYKLTALRISNNLKSIGDGAFGYCTNLESVTIPNSVTSIGKSAFEDCGRLRSVTIGGNPKIGEKAFKGISNEATVKMNLKASQIGDDKWTTFYNYAYDGYGYNFQADDYTTVYKGTVDGSSLVLTEVEDKIVDSGTAVILKSRYDPVMTLTYSNSSDTNSNSLRGISDRTSLAEVKSANNANTIYTLGNTSAGFGFHKYTGEYVPAGKAFLPLNIENGAKPILNMIFANETTGINSLSSDDNALQNDWFSLDGTRLNGKPTQRGIYINGNKKIVIK